MSVVRYSKALSSEYYRLFESAQVLPSCLNIVRDTVYEAVQNKPRYESVIHSGRFPNMPWFFIAAIHCLESSFDFTKHLHNGDPLSARTKKVPSGRPKSGNPPFSWESSAIDALLLKGLDKVSSWSLPELLWRLECYNGLGYRMYHPEVLSPYLWSFTQHYVSGKYEGDGDWNPYIISGQVGSATLIRRMLELSIISSSEVGMGIPPEEPSVVIRYSESDKIAYGDFIQLHLNQFPGVCLKVDGWPGPKTSAAFCSIYGSFLYGDDRNKDNKMKLDFSNRAFPNLPVRYSPNSVSTYAPIVQTYLNRFPNVWVSVDGVLGNLSGEEFHNIHGVGLLGDKRYGI